MATIRTAAVADASAVAALTNVIIRATTVSFKSQQTTAAVQAAAISARLSGFLGASASAAGMDSMVAALSAGNNAGIRFHASSGFSERARLSEVDRKFDRWLTLVLMQKML